VSGLHTGAGLEPDEALPDSDWLAALLLQLGRSWRLDESQLGPVAVSGLRDVLVTAGAAAAQSSGSGVGGVGQPAWAGIVPVCTTAVLL
jgi:hypothetical protein